MNAVQREARERWEHANAALDEMHACCWPLVEKNARGEQLADHEQAELDGFRKGRGEWENRRDSAFNDFCQRAGF